ncbi:MAG: hypothetical protein KF914_03330 [Rhizobiaceae bacterium]|nr:hypothetical protein [Rhizobiaceae bacterium]
MTFDEAAVEAVEWIEGHAPALGTLRDSKPRLLAPGTRKGPSGIGVAAWRLSRPRTHRAENGLVLSATAHFAVWAWAEEASRAAALIDAVFFAAMNDPVWRLSEAEPPASFWPEGFVLSLALAREIQRKAESGPTRLVEVPLIFDVQTRGGRAASERS